MWIPFSIHPLADPPLRGGHRIDVFGEFSLELKFKNLLNNRLFYAILASVLYLDDHLLPSANRILMLYTLYK